MQTPADTFPADTFPADTFPADAVPPDVLPPDVLPVGPLGPRPILNVYRDANARWWQPTWCYVVRPTCCAQRWTGYTWTRDGAHNAGLRQYSSHRREERGRTARLP